VGRPGLEPGTYGLKVRSTLDNFQDLTPVPHHSPTTLESEADPAALAAELLEAQQAGDPRWVEIAERLATIAKGRSIASGGHAVARLATELAEQVLVLVARKGRLAKRTRQ
jgi:hypothetical protein